MRSPDDIRRALSWEKKVDCVIRNPFYFPPQTSVHPLISSLDNLFTLVSLPSYPHTMAKSVRASVSKRNRANLRKKVFGPLVDARTERLAAKLQELASQPRPEVPVKSKMDLAEDEAGMYILPSFFKDTDSPHMLY